MRTLSLLLHSLQLLSRGFFPAAGHRILLHADKHALLPLLEQPDAGLHARPKLLLCLGARHDVLLGKELLHLAERAQDGAAVPVVAGVDDLVGGLDSLAVGLHSLQVFGSKLFQH